MRNSMKKNKNNSYINSADFHTVSISLDPSNPPKLTSAQKQQLHDLRNLSDDQVRQAAETDPDCEPLDKAGE